MKKLFKKNGETVVETLAATLMIATCFVMLSGAIVSAGNVNRSAQNMNANNQETNDQKKYDEASINIIHHKGSSEITSKETVNVYESNGNFYYEKKSDQKN